MKNYIVITRHTKMKKLPKGDELFYVTYNEDKGLVMSTSLAYIKYNSKIGKYEVESLVQTTAGYNKLLQVVGSTRFTNELFELMKNKKANDIVYPYNDKDIDIIGAQLSNAMNNMHE